MESCWFHLYSRQIVQILVHSHFDLVISIEQTSSRIELVDEMKLSLDETQIKLL